LAIYQAQMRSRDTRIAGGLGRDGMEIAQTGGDGVGDAMVAAICRRCAQGAMNCFEALHNLVHRGFRHEVSHRRQHLPHLLISAQSHPMKATDQPTCARFGG
jgi:hypothetical protein